MAPIKAYLSHIVIQCTDFDRMLDFYTNVLGFYVSDRGEARGQQMAFLTLDPSLEHHQIALASGLKPGTGSGSLHHVAFGVRSLEELHERHQHLKRHDVQNIELWTHATMLSVYYRDPENNRLEFFLETPYYVRQPVATALDVDLASTEEDVFAEIKSRYGDSPGFKLMSDWKKDAVARREGTSS